MVSIQENVQIQETQGRGGDMNEIIHKDERIIQILTIFASDIKNGCLSEEESIDKAASVLTAYLSGMVENERVTKNYYGMYCHPQVPMRNGEKLSDYMERIYPYVGPITCESDREVQP